MFSPSKRELAPLVYQNTLLVIIRSTQAIADHHNNHLSPAIHITHHTPRARRQRPVNQHPYSGDSASRDTARPLPVSQYPTREDLHNTQNPSGPSPLSSKVNASRSQAHQHGYSSATNERPCHRKPNQLRGSLFQTAIIPCLLSSVALSFKKLFIGWICDDLRIPLISWPFGSNWVCWRISRGLC